MTGMPNPGNVNDKQVWINPATEEKQDSAISVGESGNTKLDTLIAKDFATETGIQEVVTAIENITIPPPSGGATEVKQDTMISLIQTLQELCQRLAPIASAMSSGAPAIRTIPIASVSTAVTGSVTATVASTVVSSVTNFGTGIPATKVANDINNYTAVVSNINNVIIS